MKKIAVALLALIGFQFATLAQSRTTLHPSTFTVSFIFNDFQTAANVRANNIGNVIKNQQFGVIKKMAPGLAFSYLKGVNSNFDLTTTFAGSFVDYPIRGKDPMGKDNFLLEGDVSLRGRMFSNPSAKVNPYLQAGLGASMYKSYFGTFIPVGAGLQVNLFDESYVIATAQYRLPVSELTNYHFFFGLGIAGNIGKR